MPDYDSRRVEEVCSRLRARHNLFRRSECSPILRPAAFFFSSVFRDGRRATGQFVGRRDALS